MYINVMKNARKILPGILAAFIILPFFALYSVNAYNFFSITPGALFSSLARDLISADLHAIPVFLLLHLVRLLFIGLLFYNMLWAGDKLIKLFKLNGYPQEKQTLFAFGAGLGIYGYFIFLLGAASLLHKGVILFCLGAATVIALLNRPAFKMKKTGFNLYSLLTLPFILLMLIATTFPEIFYDSLVYHLAIPDIYLKEGGMINLPFNIYSTLPHLMSLIYTYGLVFNDVLLVKVLNFFIGALLVYTLYLEGGELPVLLFVSIPLVCLNLWCCGSDTGMALFLLLGVILFRDWLFENRENTNLLYLSGLFLGLAVSSKSTAFLGVPLLAVVVAYNYRNSLKKSYSKILLFLFFIALPVIPWLVKNIISTGNPFFPFLTGVFGAGNVPTETLNGFFSDTRDGYSGINSALGGLRKLFVLSVNSAEAGRAGFTGPVLVILLVFAIFYFKDKKVRFALLYLASCVLFWMFSTHMVRHLVPHLLILIIAVAAAMENIKIPKTAASLLLFTNIFWALLIFHTMYNGFSVVAGHETPDSYLSAEHRNIYRFPSYPAYKFLEGNSDINQDRVLIVGEAREFYCKNLSLSNSQHDTAVFFDAVSKSTGPEKLKQWAEINKIKYILINWAETKRLLPEKYRKTEYVDKAKMFLDKYSTKVFHGTYLEIYRLNA